MPSLGLLVDWSMTARSGSGIRSGWGRIIPTVSCGSALPPAIGVVTFGFGLSLLRVAHRHRQRFVPANGRHRSEVRSRFSRRHTEAHSEAMAGVASRLDRSVSLGRSANVKWLCEVKKADKVALDWRDRARKVLLKAEQSRLDSCPWLSPTSLL